MRFYFRIGILVLFLLQIVYLSYKLPQIFYLDFPFSPEVKLSASLAGILVGVLYYSKERKQDMIESDMENDEEP
jgi:hypothetical protein